jgi:hypothetical protein
VNHIHKFDSAFDRRVRVDAAPERPWKHLR